MPRKLLMTPEAIKQREYQKTWRENKRKGKTRKVRKDSGEGPDVKSAIIYLRKYQRKMEGLDGKDLLAMLALEALQGGI